MCGDAECAKIQSVRAEYAEFAEVNNRYFGAEVIRSIDHLVFLFSVLLS